MFEVNTIEFAQDTEGRRRWFRAASFSHPAKMVLGLQIYLIEHYTKVGETILDPMAGSGTVLVGCALGRNVICVELEEKFVKMIEANWEKIKSLGPMLGYKMGRVQILQGDARNIVIPDFHPPVDKIVTSPPYVTPAEVERKGMDKSRKKYEYGSKLKICGDHPNNISKLGERNYGEISAVISSPPYNAEPTVSESYKKIRSETGRDITKPSQQYAKYADAVITSPPYEDAQTGGGIAKKGYQGPKHSPTDLVGKRSYMPENIGQSNGQIGNLKSDNYLEAMLQVYRQCHQVLRDGGLLCLVVKNFIRDKKIVRLDVDTIKLCEKVGFVLKERLKRKLTQQSFWRIIYQKRFPDAPKIEFEDVLIFTRPRGFI